jgi:hypothetical protein
VCSVAFGLLIAGVFLVQAWETSLHPR